MRGYVSDKDTIRVARQRAVWRWTDLQHAIRVDRGCSEATAQRAIKRAAHAGLLLHHETSYQVTEDADRLLEAPYAYHRLDRHAFLLIMAERRAWAYTELMHEVCVRLDTTEASVIRSFRYGRDFGYIRRTTDHRWALTRLCRQQLAMWGRLEGAEGFRFAAFLSGHPKRGFTRWVAGSTDGESENIGERFPLAPARQLWRDSSLRQR
jgi:hypothetical protein